MKKNTIEIDGKTYEPIPATYGKCCVNCDLGQIRCSNECYLFEETWDDYVALKLIK